MLKMNLEYESGVLFVRMNGTLNKRFTRKINYYLIPLIKKHKIKNVILNLNELYGIDESGINAIINMKSIMKCIKGKLYLLNSDNYLIKMLKGLNIKLLSYEKDIIVEKKV